MKKFLLLFLILVCSLSVLAGPDYPKSLYDNYNTAGSPLRNTWDQTPPTTTYIPLTSNFNGGYEFVTPIVGNVDSDPRPEIFLQYLSTYTGFQYTSSGLETEYSDLNTSAADVYPIGQGMLFDATGDGDYELYYCGTRSNESVIVAYDWINDTPQELFSIVTGDNTGHTTCRMTEVGAPLTGNFSYDPTSYVDSSGRYVIFFTANVTDNRKSPNIWKIHANNGSFEEKNFRTVSSGTCTNGLLAPNVFSASFSSRPWNSLDGAGVESPQPSTSPAICPSGAYQRLYVPVECYKGSPTSGRGLLAIRMDTFSADTLFDGSGYREVVATSTQQQFSSPMCARGTALLLGYDGVGQQTNIYEASPTTITLIDQIDDPLAPNNEWVSDMFLAEMTSSSDIQYDDICFFQKDTADNSLAVYCTDVDKPLITDEVYARSNFAMSDSPQRIVHTTSAGYSLTGDSRQEIITSFGIFTPEPDGFSDGANDFNGEGFSGQELRNNNNYLPLIGTCIGADLNNDGYGDVFCTTPTNLTLIISTNINQPVDLKTVGVDVDGLMCPGNQSFFVLYDNGNGYVDTEQDSVKFDLACENNGTFTTGTYQPYGSSFSGVCPYSEGTHTAQLALTDSGSESTDTYFYTTTVSASALCITPDGLISATFDDSGDVSSEGESATSQIPDVSESVGDIFDSVGVRSQNSKDFVIVLIIVVLMSAIVYYGKENGWIVAILVGGLLMTVTTVIGLLRPIYLIVTIILGLFAVVFLKAFFGGGNK